MDKEESRRGAKVKRKETEDNLKDHLAPFFLHTMYLPPFQQFSYNCLGE